MDDFWFSYFFLYSSLIDSNNLRKGKHKGTINQERYPNEQTNRKMAQIMNEWTRCNEQTHRMQWPTTEIVKFVQYFNQ